MHCLVCGCEKKRVLTRLCSNMKIMGPSFPEKDSFVAACPECGHVYVDIDVTQDAFTEYYSSDYSKSLSYIEVFGRENAEAYYTNIEKRIARHIGKDAHILEIGGGIGELARFLKDDGYEDITVLEPSERCIRLCAERGVDAILSDGFTVPEGMEGAYDFIIINHTLEHILRFDLTMKSAWRMLKPGGKMYIEVPDASKYADTDFVPYWFFTYEHLFHWSLENYDNLAAAFRFKILEKESYLKCHSYQVMYAILEKCEDKREIKYYGTAENAVRRYIEQCEGKLEPVVQDIKRSGDKIILWGIGASTAQLLNGAFDELDVIKIVDSNPYRQNVTYTVGGKKLRIEDPSTITEEGTILILPLMYDTSIREQIKRMGLKNPIRSLSQSYKGDN